MNVYFKDGNVATKNLTPGISVYGEELIKEDEEYRIWNPKRSKLAAALLNGLENLEILDTSKVLYLGASTGTTVSHISDIVINGRVYAVEFSPTTAKKLVQLSRQRSNIAPILGDATKPKEYLNIVEKTDLVYCDVAQPTQTELFMRNMNLFSRDDGVGLLMIKARSIDVVQKPKKVFKEQEKKLKEKIKEKKHPSAMCGGANHQARAIEQYTIDGQYIKTFPSAQDAADELKIDYSSIKSAASIKNLRHKTSGGYIWIHEDEPNKKQIIEQAQNKGCEKPVSQYSLDGKHIRDFASIKEAMSFFNMKSNHISAVCDGKRKTSSGYIWKWKTA